MHKSKSRLEDVLFSIMLKIPEHYLPSFFMNWIERYTNKRIAELNHSIIKDTWKIIELKKSIEHHSKS